MFDLSSVITGAVIVGMLGAVTAATFTFVIPWFNDKAANDDLSLIKMAEDSHYSDKGTYGDINALYTGRYLHKTQAPACVSVANPNFTVYVSSKSGKKFSYSSSTGTTATVTSIPCTLVTK